MQERGRFMILTDYYKFERVATISKHRMDCTASTGSYSEFEQLRKAKALRQTEKRDAISVGDLLVYWVTPDGHIRNDRKRQADRCITMGSKNLSSVYNRLQGENYCFAYGDIRGTTDALLFLYHIEEVNTTIQQGAWLEIFVARGKANECNQLCCLFEDGELDDEINTLRERAKAINIGAK